MYSTVLVVLLYAERHPKHVFRALRQLYEYYDYGYYYYRTSIVVSPSWSRGSPCPTTAFVRAVSRWACVVQLQGHGHAARRAGPEASGVQVRAHRRREGAVFRAKASGAIRVLSVPGRRKIPRAHHSRYHFYFCIVFCVSIFIYFLILYFCVYSTIYCICIYI